MRQFHIPSIFFLLLLLPLISPYDLNIHFSYDAETDKLSFADITGHSSNLRAGKTMVTLTQNEQTFDPDQLLNAENKLSSYISEVLDGKFEFSVYELSINDTLVKMVQVKYLRGINVLKEIFLDLDESFKANSFPKDNEFPVYAMPDLRKDVYFIEQSKNASSLGYKVRDKHISDTYGFKLSSDGAHRAMIQKVLLVTKRKGKYDYFADLTTAWELSDKTVVDDTRIESTYVSGLVLDMQEQIDFYLLNLPEKFDLYVYLALTDENGLANGEKMILMQKDIEYPNFGMEKSINPNYGLGVVAVVLIVIVFILTLIFVAVKAII